MIVPELKKAF